MIQKGLLFCQDMIIVSGLFDIDTLVCAELRLIVL